MDDDRDSEGRFLPNSNATATKDLTEGPHSIGDHVTIGQSDTRWRVVGLNPIRLKKEREP